MSVSAPTLEGENPYKGNREIISCIASGAITMGNSVVISSGAGTTNAWTVEECLTENKVLLGIALNDAADGKRIAIQTSGIARAIAYAAIITSATIGGASNGRVESVSDLATFLSNQTLARGLCISGATAAGSDVLVLLF